MLYNRRGGKEIHDEHDEMSEISYVWLEKVRKSVPLNMPGRTDSPESYNSHYRSFYVKYQ